MEQNLFKYIWRHSKAEQLGLLLLVLSSLPFYFPRARPAQDHRQQRHFRGGIRRGGIDAVVPDHLLAIWQGPVRGTGVAVRRCRAGAARLPHGLVLRLPVHGDRERQLQALHQHAEGSHGRAHAASPALRADRPHAAVPYPSSAQAEAGRGGEHDQCRSGAVGRVHRRLLRAADPGWRPGDHRHDLHHVAECLAGLGGVRDRDVSGFSDPKASGADPASGPSAADHRACVRRPGRRARRRLARDLYQRHLEFRALGYFQPLGTDLPDPVRDLPAQVFCQISQ